MILATAASSGMMRTANLAVRRRLRSCRGGGVVGMVRGSIRGLLTPDNTAPSFETACETGAGGLRDAVDLLLVHSEGPTGGDAPRGVLNPLIVLLAVSAWERLVYELANPAGISLPARTTVGRFAEISKKGPRTVDILLQATNGVLPSGLRVTVYDSAQGKRLSRPRVLDASVNGGGEFHDQFDEYLELRNGVAHRVVPDKIANYASWRTDAARNLPPNLQHLAGHTINASVARSVVAAYIQLVDQTIAHVCFAQAIPSQRARQLRLPTEWFTDDVERAGQRRPLRPGCLWGGTRLPRT